MAVLIDVVMVAKPAKTRLPSGPVQLTQTVHSDLGGETAQIVYTLDGRNNVVFLTPQGPQKKLTIANVTIPGTPTQRTDTVTLGEINAGTGIDQLVIKQLITGEENSREDAVNLIILDDPP